MLRPAPYRVRRRRYLFCVPNPGFRSCVIRLFSSRTGSLAAARAVRNLSSIALDCWSRQAVNQGMTCRVQNRRRTARPPPDKSVPRAGHMQPPRAPANQSNTPLHQKIVRILYTEPEIALSRYSRPLAGISTGRCFLLY